MERELVILLPEVIPVIAPRHRASITIDPEEYALYFAAMIHPLRPEYDVETECDYGGNFGDCWKISVFPEGVKSFPLTVRVYDEWGRKLAEKTCCIQVREKQMHPEEYRILCIGDSLTHSNTYVNHMATKLACLRTVGIRSFNGTVRHEGRGGWMLTDFVGRHADWWGGVSPFVFPVGIGGREYYGDRSFQERLRTPDLDSYCLDGLPWEPIREGQYFHDGEKLWRHTGEGDEPVDDAPRWEFSFAKYMEKYGVERPHAVSILLGANDLHASSYEEGPARVRQFMDELEEVVASIHAYDPTIDIILNLPIMAAEQYAWGFRGRGSAKRFQLHTLYQSMALLERWDGRAAEHVHICPMRLCTDPVYGYDAGAFRANPYTARLTEHANDNLHPGEAGYRQMGDALAAMVEYLRQG